MGAPLGEEAVAVVEADEEVKIPGIIATTAHNVKSADKWATLQVIAISVMNNEHQNLHNNYQLLEIKILSYFHHQPFIIQDQSWYADSGASHHCIPDSSNLQYSQIIMDTHKVLLKAMQKKSCIDLNE
ncbi:hypothetical protein PIB30_005300 [Stylosanthes scabra]|uniref:Uncharacterized protein n=1 Tax=Stylosanthes scabra TaxID=79078 RepID=A0ABU6U5Y9_9FABA|nr:hypothetical protein [Stylosanthes scabra]